ncbi:MAG: T9SS type A sorting domain-containing protein [Bacteroidetes bacterium]|nr:T9SS type A sorting domain-containing protein [Bacteroidota bacterium]
MSAKSLLLMVIGCFFVGLVKSQTTFSSAYLTTSGSEFSLDFQCGETYSNKIENIKFGILPLIKPNSTNTEILTASQIYFSNPSNGGFLDGYSNQRTVLVIFNSNGRKVLECPVYKEFNINTSSLSKGIYTLQFTDGGKKEFYYKWLN